MMEILLDLTASFSVVEKRLSTLISDVSEIKQKQDNLQHSLYCLQLRKSDGECQRWRKSPSPKSSTPVKRKPAAAWYVADSFAEQFTPPTQSHSLAQSSFELGYPSNSLAQTSFNLGYPSHLLAVPHLQRRKTLLDQSAKPVEKGVEKRYPLSAVPHPQQQQGETLAPMAMHVNKEHQHQLQRETQQADMPYKLPDDAENRENNDPDFSSKSAAVDSGEVLSIPLDSDVIMKIRYVSLSRRNFSANLNRKIFTMAERKVSNINGVLGKSKLDPDKVKYIKKVTFQMYPLSSKESEATEWSNCISAIDEVNRRLNNSKNKKGDKKGKK